MRRVRALAIPFILVFVAMSCGPAAVPPPEPVTEPETVAEPSHEIVQTTLKKVGLDGEALDSKVGPCDDFFTFACGGWIGANEIPADKPRWGRFNEIDDRNQTELKRILEAAVAKENPDPISKQIGDYYAACMNEELIEKQGIRPAKRILRRVDKVWNNDSLMKMIAALHKQGTWVVFDIFPEQDHKDTTKMIAALDQNGLGLPDRDMYLGEDERSKNIRKEYQAHITRMFRLMDYGPKAAETAANQVVAMETEIAQISKTRVERRDVQGMYNKIDREGVKKAAPSFDWDGYFEAMGIKDVTDINVTSVAFFEGFEKILNEAKTARWKAYFDWHIVRTAAPTLNKAFDDESFVMKKLLTGQQAQPPRWKRCVEATNQALGEALSQPYVESMFAGESKEAAVKMVEDISNAFAARVGELDWMSEETQKKAVEKKEVMEYLIGYPDEWRKYDFDIARDRYAENAVAAGKFKVAYNLGKIGKPVDKKEWHMSPAIVNAYYHPQQNHMVFPAGILQPPFYHKDFHTPVNYGAIGMVIAHELTHGFDDMGSQFAGDGNLVDWWTEADKKNFKEKGQCLVNQYGEYEVVKGTKLNGELTLGENIADLGGVKLAFRAYRAAREDAPERLVADGYTEDQQFFMAVGQAWCTMYRDEFARMMAQVDPHSHPKYRVNGSVSNLPEFAEAFKCQEGSPMNPKDACSVW